jgi:sarcosine oxidase subunit beta
MVKIKLMNHYSAFSLLRNAFAGQRDWARIWRDPEPAKHYDVVIVGAGGHGLATAYYLARHQGVKNIAVLEKGYLGGGNSGRNTQVCRSNYFYPQSGAFYEHSLSLFENLGQDLNFNVMFSQRGVLAVCNSLHELEIYRRWANSIRMNGIDSELLGREDVRKYAPHINLDCRYPIRGGFIQKRAGISRHDAVVWAYARQASAAGVDIIQQCEVTGMETSDNRITSVDTSRGKISADQFALCVAGHSSHLAAMAGLRLPITSVALQAMVTEPVRPIIDTVLMSAHIHAYVSQSDRGELVTGGGVDPYNSYAQRGSMNTQQDNYSALVELMPIFSRLRMMRHWAGVCDMAYDVSPIVGKTPIENLYISTGWGTGGYKAIPAGGDTLAHTIVNDRPHELLQPFQLDRFETGRLVDEGAASGVSH